MTVDRLKRRFGDCARALDRAQALILVALIALTLRVWLFVGSGQEDDPGFTGYAWDLAFRGDLKGISDQALRRMVFLPVAFFYYVYGSMNVVTTHIAPILEGVLTVVLVFLIADRLFGRATAVLSGLFLAFCPLHIAMSTRTMPGLPESFWGTMAFALFILGDCDGLLPGKRRSALTIGVVCAFCYLSRETGIVVLAAILLATGLQVVLDSGRRRLRFRQGIWIVAGFALIFALETAWNYSYSGDLLFRYHTVHRFQNIEIPDVGPDWKQYYINTLLRLGKHPDEVWDPAPGLQGWWILLSAPLYTLFQFRRHSRAVAIWFWAYFLFLTFASTGFDAYHPIRRFPRYVMLFLPPASICAGWLLGAIYRLQLRRIPMGALLAVPVAGGMFAWSFSVAYEHHYWAQGVFATEAEVLKICDRLAGPNGTVWGDVWDVGIWLRMEGLIPDSRLQIVEYLKPDEHPEGYAVFPEGVSDQQLCLNKCTRLMFEQLPSGWERVRAIDPVHGAYFKQGYRPVIYHVPAAGRFATDRDTPRPSAIMP